MSIMCAGFNRGETLLADAICGVVALTSGVYIL